MGIGYRLHQFRQDLFAGPLSDEAKALVVRWLSPAEQALFSRYVLADQWHTIRVARQLLEAGETQPSLIKAALLHDVGKSQLRLTLFDRSIAVLLKKLWPSRARRWGQGEPSGWKRPFVVRAQHAEWGARLAEAAGSDSLTISLIRRHQDPVETAVWATDAPAADEENRLLARLQWADDQN